LGYSGHREAANVAWPGAETAFVIFNWGFGVLFCLEAMLKVTYLGTRYFADLWNWLDFVVVLSFLFDKIASAVVPLDAKALRFWRLIRLMRLVRLVRTMESLDHLYIMTTAIKDMYKVLFWAVALLSVMLMMAALLLTQVLQATYFDKASAAELSPQELETHRKLYEYFGTFTRCMLSMFELTLANWAPVTRLLSEEVSEWFVILCLVHKLTMGFAVIGVINGVILQETFKVAATDDVIMMRQRKRSSELMAEKMGKLLEGLDHSGDGELDFAEFSTISCIPEVGAWLASMDIETDDLPTLFKLIDVDHNGSITVDELAKRIPRIRGAARSIDLLKMGSKLEKSITKILETTSVRTLPDMGQFSSPGDADECNQFVPQDVWLASERSDI